MRYCKKQGYSLYYAGYGAIGLELWLAQDVKGMKVPLHSARQSKSALPYPAHHHPDLVHPGVAHHRGNGLHLEAAVTGPRERHLAAPHLRRDSKCRVSDVFEKYIECPLIPLIGR
jgi:hypothetical protein